MGDHRAEACGGNWEYRCLRVVEDLAQCALVHDVHAFATGSWHRDEKHVTRGGACRAALADAGRVHGDVVWPWPTLDRSGGVHLAPAPEPTELRVALQGVLSGSAHCSRKVGVRPVPRGPRATRVAAAALCGLLVARLLDDRLPTKRVVIFGHAPLHEAGLRMGTEVLGGRWAERPGVHSRDHHPSVLRGGACFGPYDDFFAELTPELHQPSREGSCPPAAPTGTSSGGLCRGVGTQRRARR